MELTVKWLRSILIKSSHKYVHFYVKETPKEKPK